MTGIKKYTFLIGLGTLLAYACKKGSDSPISVGKTAQMNIIDAITDINGLNYYLNGTRQNSNSAIYFSGSSGYSSFPIGTQQYQFKANDSVRTLIAEFPINLPAADSSYSVVLAGQRSSGNITAIQTADHFSDTATTKAKIRFVQASAGTSNYDVFVGDTLSFKNQAFKNVTAFARTGPGKKTVKVMLAGSSTVLYTTSITVQAGTYYTLFTAGSPSLSGVNALTTGIVLSK